MTDGLFRLPKRTWCLPFSADALELIRRGRKNTTRRRWRKPRVKEGGTYPIGRDLCGMPWGRIHIITRIEELWVGASVPLGGQDAEAGREGFSTWQAFADWWLAAYGKRSYGEPCWAMTFRVVEWLRICEHCASGRRYDSPGWRLCIHPRHCGEARRPSNPGCAEFEWRQS
jgi:hypothetical protein